MTWFLDSMVRQQDRAAVGDGLRAAVRLYYEDNTDADSVDPAFFLALERIGEYADLTPGIDELIEEEEDRITEETGRRFAHQDENGD